MTTEHVIIVDIDAFDPSYLDIADTPHIDALARQGSFGLARGVYKSFSNPARCSIITGAWPAVHHNQAYYFDPVRDIAVGQERPYEDDDATPLKAETIAQTMKAEGRTVAGVEYDNLNGYGIEPGDPAYLLATVQDDCAARTDAAIDILHRRPVDSSGTSVTVPRVPDLLMLYWKDLDNLGHADGPQSRAMPGLVSTVDQQIGRLVQATRAVGIADRTTFIVVSDHGMVYIAEPILPDLLRALDLSDFQYDVVPIGARPAPDAEIVLVPTSRNVDFTLRGAADSSRGREVVAGAVRQLGERAFLHEAEDLARMRAQDRIGHLVAEAVSPCHFGADVDRPAGGGHGGSAEMSVPLLLSGCGIRTGVEMTGARLVDVAPTACALLGVRPPADSDGRVLSKSLLAGAESRHMEDKEVPHE